MKSNTYGYRRPAKRRRLPSIWLATLPHDVLLQIVLHATGRQQNDDALCIAETTPCLRMAVLSLLSHHFTLPTKNADRWVRVFAGSAQSLFMSSPSIGSTTPNVVNLLKSKALQSVRMWELNRFLRPLAEARSLRKLSIYLCKRDHHLLLQTLAVLNLSDLEIRCAHQADPFSRNWCLLTNPPAGLLRSRCPQLRVLAIDSRCITPAGLIPLISPLTLLRRLSLNIARDCEGFSDRDVNVLKGIPHVELHMAPDIATVAPKLGPVLSTLRIVSPLNCRQLQDIANNCIYLQSLQICLDIETEPLFINCVALMRNLRDLVIDYCMDFDPSPGIISGVVRSAPRLTALDVGNIRIPLQELLTIVKYMGPRLLSLVTSHSEQDERDCESVAMLLEAISAHNSNIQCLKMFPALDEPTHVDSSIGAWQNWRQRIRRAQATLATRAPHLDHYHINRVADKVCGTCENPECCKMVALDKR